MQTKFGVFRSLFSPKFEEISPRNFAKRSRIFVESNEISLWSWRNFVYSGTGTLFYMFPTDFRFRNHVFPQSLTCVYVAETRYSVPETCYFVRSTGGNVKDTVWQPDLFFCVSVCFRYCVNTSKKFHICRNQVFQWEFFFILTWN